MQELEIELLEANLQAKQSQDENANLRTIIFHLMKEGRRLSQGDAGAGSGADNTPASAPTTASVAPEAPARVNFSALVRSVGERSQISQPVGASASGVDPADRGVVAPSSLVKQPNPSLSRRSSSDASCDSVGMDAGSSTEASDSYSLTSNLTSPDPLPGNSMELSTPASATLCLPPALLHMDEIPTFLSSFATPASSLSDSASSSHCADPPTALAGDFGSSAVDLNLDDFLALDPAKTTGAQDAVSGGLGELSFLNNWNAESISLVLAPAPRMSFGGLVTDADRLGI